MHPPRVATLYDSFLAELVRRGWAASGDRVVIAVSGGVDSVCLLRFFGRAAATLELRLAVAHANHGLRPEADSEERFVGDAARSVGAEFFPARLTVRHAARLTGDSLEMAARRLRHGFLARTAAAFGARVIALGHHADDQAELFFVRLLRGAGPAGLGGMDWSSPSPADPDRLLIRPFLALRRRELAAEAERNGWPWMEDASNADVSILRNWVRHQALPFLEAERAPALRATLSRAMTLLRDEAAYVAAEAERWLGLRRRPRFERLAPALQREIIRRQLWLAGVEGGFDLVEKLREGASGVSVAPGRRLSAPGGVVDSLGAGEKPPETPAQGVILELSKPRGSASIGDGSIAWRGLGDGPDRPARRAASRLEWLDADAVGATATLRTWRPGDRFRPLGFPKASKLQNLFTNRKIPAADRRRLKVAAAADGRIFWVEGLPPGEEFKVTPATRRWLRWTWTGRRSEPGRRRPPGGQVRSTQQARPEAASDSSARARRPKTA